MKKITILLLSIVCACCFVFAMTGCNQENKPTDSSIQSDTTNSDDTTSQGQEPNSSNQGQTPNSSEGQTPNSSSSDGGDVPPAVTHEHKYGEGEWVYDETNHWEKCTATEGECDAPKINVAKHTFDSKNVQCTVCKFHKGAMLFYAKTIENGKAVEYYISGLMNKNVSVVTIPAEHNGLPVTYIGHEAFNGCNNLTSVTIADSVTQINEYAFSGCPLLKYNEYDNALYLGSVENPYLFLIKAKDTSITSCNVNSGTKVIADNAFKDCVSLTSVTLPNTLTHIGEEAFCGCTSLANVSLPNSIIRIREFAFRNCVCITNVTFPNGLTSIDRGVFIGTGLTSVTIPKGVTSVGDCAFMECKSLTDVSLPDSVTSTDSSAFSGCPLLKYNEYDNALYLGDDSNPYLLLMRTKDDSITSCEINSNTRFVCGFSGCIKLASITIPDSVTYISDFAFSTCTRLKSVTIGNGVTHIGAYAFLECVQLTSITLPNSVTSVGNYVFKECTSLTNINLPESLTTFEYGMFDSCTSLKYNEYDNALYLGNDSNPYLWLVKAKSTAITSCNINSKTKVIYDSAFENCYNLTRITIPDNVTVIGNEAFYKCDRLKSVIIGNGVTTLNYRVFSECSALTDVTVGNSITYIHSWAFTNTVNITYLYFYGTAEEWANNTVLNSSHDLVKFKTYIYSETEPTQEGDYWHYVDGKPVAWA